MKFILPLFASVWLAGYAQAETYYESPPLTGNDIAEVLALKPEGFNVQKYQVNFDKPMAATLLITTPGDAKPKEVKLPGKTKSATVMTYSLMNAEGEYQTLSYWFRGDGGAISSGFPAAVKKMQVTEAGVLDGVFTITASATKDSPEHGYVLQVIASEE